MTKLADEKLNYESKWATLTFAIRNETKLEVEIGN